jgi:hypothetical protein
MALMPAPPPCPGKPDLKVTKISTSTPLKIGHNLNQFQITVMNGGTAPAGNFFFTVELCPASGPCNSPLSVGGGVFNGNQLLPGNSVPLNVNNGFYLAIQPGMYKLRVKVDSTNMAVECNENNNVRLTIPLKFVPVCQQPDFFSFGAGPNPYQPNVTRGQTVTVSISVFNQGGPFNGPAVPVKLFLGNVQSGQMTPVNWQGMLNPMPTAGQQHFTMQQVQIPATGLTAGAKYMWAAQADASGNVAECDKGNNWSSPNGPVFQVN